MPGMFENLTVERLTLHHVFKRAPGGERVTPIYARSVFRPEGDIKRLIEQRLVKAVANQSKAMTVDIVKTGADTTFQLGRQAAFASEDEFIRLSTRITDALADAQTTQVPPEGFLFIIHGATGYPALPFIALMKAEPQSGFSIDESDAISLTLLDQLVLTPASKLYKVGIFVERDGDLSNDMDAKGWEAVVFDQRMTQADRQNASKYYYDTFLGCALPKDSAYLTKRFYELTSHYANNAISSPQEQADTKTALYSYLKIDVSPTISVEEFTERYLSDDADRATDFKNFMESEKFSTQAFSKDIGDIKSKLSRRTVSFPSGIRLTGSVESFSENVKIEYKLARETGESHDKTVIEINENPTEA